VEAGRIPQKQLVALGAWFVQFIDSLELPHAGG
jgi:hypothetical protein